MKRQSDQKKATSKWRKASPENRARKLERTPKLAEYGERNAKENNKGHK